MGTTCRMSRLLRPRLRLVLISALPRLLAAWRMLMRVGAFSEAKGWVVAMGKRGTVELGVVASGFGSACPVKVLAVRRSRSPLWR